MIQIEPSNFPPQSSRERKHIYVKRLTQNNDIVCLPEIHGKDEFLQAFQVLAPRFRLHGTFIPKNANSGGSATCIHKDLLPDDALVTHVVTCQGRDHVVSIRSGCRSLVIVNVHFEPELTLRSLRERSRRITPQWPPYPEAVGIVAWDFNLCEPEAGRFNVWNQSFSEGDTGKSALFHSFFPRVLEIAQPDFTRRDATADGTFRTLSRIDRAFINLRMAEARDFHCYSPVLENLGKRSIPSDHAAVRDVLQKPTTRSHQGKRIPSWMSKHPVFCFNFETDQ